MWLLLTEALNRGAAFSATVCCIWETMRDRGIVTIGLRWFGRHIEVVLAISKSSIAKIYKKVLQLCSYEHVAYFRMMCSMSLLFRSMFYDPEWPLEIILSIAGHPSPRPPKNSAALCQYDYKHIVYKIFHSTTSSHQSSWAGSHTQRLPFSFSDYQLVYTLQKSKYSEIV